MTSFAQKQKASDNSNVLSLFISIITLDTHTGGVADNTHLSRSIFLLCQCEKFHQLINMYKGVGSSSLITLSHTDIAWWKVRDYVS